MKPWFVPLIVLEPSLNHVLDDEAVEDTITQCTDTHAKTPLPTGLITVAIEHTKANGTCISKSVSRSLPWNSTPYVQSLKCRSCVYMCLVEQSVAISAETETYFLGQMWRAFFSNLKEPSGLAGMLTSLYPCSMKS